MKIEFTQEEIEAFVEGTLDMERSNALKAAIPNNPELQKAVRLQQVAQKALIKDALLKDLNQAKDALKEEGFFQQVHQEVSPSKGRQFPLFGKFLGLAAILTGIFFLFFFFPKASGDVVANYFELYEDRLSEDLNLIIETRSDEEQQGIELLQKAMQAYNKKQFEQADALFQEYFDVGEEILKSNEVNLYSGIAALGAGQHEKAKKILSALAAAKDYPHADVANWYLALTEIRLDQKDTAKERLQKLTKTKRFGDKANQLLSEIKQ